MTDMVIDYTEFKVQHAINLDLNSIIFSNYKNTLTSKGLIGVSTHGAGLLLSDIFHDLISGSALTGKTSRFCLG